MDDRCKTLLVVNNSENYKITVYIWDKICWIFGRSKIISPGERFPYRQDTAFKYGAVVIGSNLKKTTVIQTTKCTEDAVVIVNSDLSVEKGNLSDYPQEKQICVRRLNMEEETAVDSVRDFYKLLKIDRKKLSKLSEEKKLRLIRSKYHQEVRRWHPDSNPVSGDANIFNEVRDAYRVLADPERRADYNNLLDYDSGILSKIKSIFWSECYTPQQRKSYWKRMGCSVLSLVMACGGAILMGLTAGLAAPLAVPCAVVGGGLFMAGIQGGLRTTKRESVEKGLDMKKYTKSTCIGFVAGAATGGVGIGVAAGVVGLGTAALPAAQVGVKGFIACGAAAGGAGGLAGSLADSADLVFVDKENLTGRQILGRGAVGAVGGAAVGVLGGALSAVMTDDIVGAAAGRRFFKQAAKEIGRSLSENVSGNLIDSSAQFVEERLDRSVENRPFTQHAVKTLKRAATNAGMTALSKTATAAGKCAWDEICVESRTSSQSKSSSPQLTEAERASLKMKVREEYHIEKGTDVSRWKDHEVALPSKFSTLEPITEETKGTRPTQFSETVTSSARCGCVQYISKGHWFSKIVVRYLNNIGEETREESESGRLVDIPNSAKNIEVSFLVNRGTWCDLKKFDRKTNTWCEPTCPHVFRYDRPPIRTYTIGGGLYFERVLKVTNAQFDTIDEM